MTSTTNKQGEEAGFGFKPRRPLEAKQQREYAYAINSEADYNHAVACLADELLKEHSPEQVAQIAAMNIIYVDTLEVRGDSLERLTDALNREAKQKISKRDFLLLATRLWNKAKGLNPAKGGSARHKNDPKSKDKDLVLMCWRDWKKNPNRYKSKAAFARDMLTRSQHLESNKVIEGWCRAWEKSEPC